MHLILVSIYIKDGSVRRTEAMLGISKTRGLIRGIRYFQSNCRGWSVHKSEPPLAFHSASAALVPTRDTIHRTGTRRKPPPITAALQSYDSRQEAAMEANVLPHPRTPTPLPEEESPPSSTFQTSWEGSLGLSESQSPLAVGSE